MPMFRKKPVVIEAMQFHRPTDFKDAPGWLVSAIAVGTVHSDEDGDVFIETLEGRHHVSEGDWIIRGVKGELYPCKPDIFAATYEPA